MGSAGTTALLSLADHPDPVIRTEVMRQMGALGRSAPEGVLAGAVQSPNARVRLMAAVALMQNRDARAQETLAALLRDPAPDVRREAAYALANAGDTRAADVLVPLLTDADPDVHRQVVWGLVALGDQRIIDPLLADLAGADMTARFTAIHALCKIDNTKVVEAILAAVPGLWEAKDAPSGHQRQLVQSLQDTHNPRLVALLVDRLKQTIKPQDIAPMLQPYQHPRWRVVDGEPNDSDYPIVFLRQMQNHGPAVVEPFVAALSDVRPEVRAGCAILLAEARITGWRRNS